MSDLFIGNTICGNFTVAEPVDSLDGFRIEKYDGLLHLVKGNSNLVLTPLDDDGRLVVDDFSDEVGDACESIYKLEKNNNIIVIILYVYSQTIKLLAPQKKMAIYLGREMEIRLTSDEGLLKGLLHVDDVTQVPTFLKEQFMQNQSIFISQDRRNSQAGSFMMYGKSCRAEALLERTGVYRINHLYPTRNKDYYFSLTQIFGNVSFVRSIDAISIPSADSTPLQSAQTSQVFKAWEEYMNFERELYSEELDPDKFIPFDGFEVVGTELHFKVPLLKDFSEDYLRSTEFEFVATSMVSPLPQTREELVDFKAKPLPRNVYVGRCLNEEFEDELIFNLPHDRNFDNYPSSNGILYVSDHSQIIEQRRRKKVLMEIESHHNESANIIMRLSDPNVKDTQTGNDINPINKDVLVKMFKNPNIQLNENYREAMKIALNTPDIALIQGPPGTGKTTLIVGLITRLNLMDKNLKILVSAEQHEALKNVIEKLSTNKLIPPFVSSRRYEENKEDEVTQETLIRNFQNSFVSLCEDLLRNNKNKNSQSVEITKFVYLVNRIKESGYSANVISENIDELNKSLIALGCFADVSDDFSKLKNSVSIGNPSNSGSDEENSVTKLIQRRIESQRLDLSAFLEDDGTITLERLQSTLEKLGYKDFLMKEELKKDLLSDHQEKVKSRFGEYVSYVNNLQQRFFKREDPLFDHSEEDNKALLNHLVATVNKKLSGESKDFYQIVEMLMYRLNDIEASADLIRKYTSIIGSTCAQAEKSIDALQLEREKYDVVIIDEAARANPLDIMIPMMMGTRVILIGDHKQLPHYIETGYLKRFEQDKEKRYERFDKRLLAESLFQIIYENLDSAYNEGRIKYRRTIRINEQHRMNPAIGTFISNEFYEGELTNASETVNKVNDYHVLGGRNVAWIDVPIFKGREMRIGQSLERPAEIDVIYNFLKDLIRKNPSRKLDVGIISYYKGQVEPIREMLQKSFPESAFSHPISEIVDTVDSFQGKEFDIVICSGVRSNDFITAEKALGFIHYSPSRINVSLSRAKKVLLFVGDSDTYLKDSHFRNFISYVKKVGYYA